MRDAFEKVAKVYEGAKESVKNKWENFKKKFEGTKSEMSQEVMKAETPEDLIALGEKLKQQGEALKVEQVAVKEEETEKGKLEAEKGRIYESDRDEALEEDAARNKEKAHSEALEENKAFDEVKAAKAAEEEAKRKAELAELDRLQAEEDAKKATELLKKIKSGDTEVRTAENVDMNSTNEKQEKLEDIYGMSKEDAQKLLDSKGYLDEEIKANDPKFKEKLEEFHNNQRKYSQLRVKLFNRVLSGTATEEEMKLAEEHAADQAKTFKLSGFHDAVPKSWYSSERLSNAMMADSRSENKEFIKHVRETYTEEQLKKGGFEKIGEDGFAHTYYEKGF